MLFTSSSICFASSNSLDVKTNSTQSISDTEDLNFEPSSNRHYYVTEKGPRQHRGTEWYTALQAEDRNFISSLASSVILLGTPPIGPITAFTYKIADHIYHRGMSTGGRIVFYRTVETRYRVNRLTGQRVKTDTFYYFEVDIFSGSTKTATYTHRARLK